MTSEYGIQTRNTFDLLDEDAPTPRQTKPKETKEEPKKDVKRTSDRDRATPRVEGGDRRVDGGERGRGGRGGGRGRGRGGRGGGEGREGGRERKEYDAHISRSGKTREPKKEGAGKFNEGSSRDVIADGTAEDRRLNPRRSKEDDATDNKEETEGSAVEASTTEGAEDTTEEKSGKAAVKVEPEEPLTRTYDQFLASKQKLDSDLAIQRREAQNDESQFKAVKVHARAAEQNPYIIAPAGEEKEKPAKAKKDKAKHISLDEFTATAAGNSAGARGGRGGRGRGGGRGGRGGDSKSLAVTESNFPALAPKEKK